MDCLLQRFVSSDKTLKSEAIIEIINSLIFIYYLPQIQENKTLMIVQFVSESTASIILLNMFYSNKERNTSVFSLLSS